MLQNTPSFIIFFISITILFFIIPVKTRKGYLLLISYMYAYLIGGASTCLTLLAISLITYGTAILISKKHHLSWVRYVYLVFVIAALAYGKYTGLAINTINRFNIISVPSVSVVAMIGISYYTFSAISYIEDVAKEKVSADCNIINVMLWLSFFPKLIAGPIERYDRFVANFEREDYLRFDQENVKRGLLIAAWGYFQKIMIADRIGLLVDTVYADLEAYQGVTLVLVMLLYSVQIYTDFAGYSYIALGLSRVLGITLTKNFNHPYFADSFTDFWSRWHISLSTWLRDYIYIPLGGNRKGLFRQYLNLLATFLISGIWHGADWSYLLWGGLHGVYQVIEKIMMRNKYTAKLFQSESIRLLRMGIVYLFVSIAWIFFRAEHIHDGILFLKQMVSSFNPWVITDGTIYNIGLDMQEWGVLLIALLLMIVIEVMQEKNISIYNILQKQHIIVRWLCYYGIILALLIFGIYGSQYNAANFIYFQY